MLTRNDETLPTARSLVPVARASGVRDVGAKDIGLPLEELGELFAELRVAGCVTYLEVVGDSAEAMIQSARNALELRPDYVIGGTEVARMARVLTGSGIKFFPYVGTVIDHPCLLRGRVADIVSDALAAEASGVDGINLLAYRYDGDVPTLVEAVVRAVEIPVLCAGSVDSAERIALLRALGTWGFTVGTAVLDGAFVPGGSLADQLRRVHELAAGA
jgi:NAD(P)H-dependent flavin oxidoreductase YrpB (nitropropane dioxygenase family)